MKHLMKRSFSMLMALVMIFSLFAGISFTASAAEGSIVDYQYAFVSDTYSSVVKNWGTRGEPATFLSPMAEEFYAETSYEELAALDGSSDITVVNTSALYVALHTLMAEAHTKTTSYDATRDLFQYTDSQKNGTATTQISAFYSGEKIGPDWDGGKTWNREHTWPDSKGGSGTHENDIMMLRPEAGNVNSSRNNKAYGVSEGYFNPNTGSYNLHGDVARIMLYQYVRWGGVTQTADNGTVTYTNQALLDSMWGESGVIESLDVLLAWAAEDPVDTWELARNDSVQSITGTRNVFVDYPELVFELFEAEIPAGYDTPSGSANTAPFTITANVDGDGGKVSVNGEYVTAHPYAGYQVSSINGATFIRIDDVYLITSDADCTVTVTFAELDQYTVNVYENGEVVATAEVYDGNIYKLPEYAGTLPEGYAFRGWVAAEQEASANQPGVIYAPGTELPIDDNYNYYALMTYLNADDQTNVALTYELVDSVDDIKVGSYYVITNSDGTKALGTTQADNNRPAVDVTKSNNILVFAEDANVAELLLGEGIPVTEPEATEPPATEPGTSTEKVYKKVTSAPADWSGEYLIVYEAGKRIFDGSLTTLDASNNYKEVGIANGEITGDYSANSFTIGSNGSIRSKSEYYIGRDSDSNGMESSTSIVYTNTITFNDDGTVHIVGSGKSVLRYNATSGQDRFRYFKSSTYGGQKAICLYKLEESGTTVEPSEPTEPEVTETEPAEPEVTETQPAEPTPTETEPAVTGWVKVTDASQFTTGKYVMIVETGIAPLRYDSASSGWLVTAQPTVSGDMVTDTKGAEWTLTVNGSNVTITDSNGKSIKPKSGNNNGIQTGSYNWAWSFANGAFTFKGTGSDSTTLASNTSSSNKFRSYKNTTVTDTKTYKTAFTLYKYTDGTASVAEKSATRAATSTPTYTFYDATEANAGYLYAASSSNNWLRTQAAVDANASWNITVNEDGTCTLIATGANTKNNLQYNSNSDIFSCYSTQQVAVSLYVGVPGAGTMYYTTVWGARTCEHANTTTTTVDATCGTDGSTTVTCNDCNSVVSVTVIPATGNHANTTTTTVEATCGAAGSTTVFCNDCETTVSEETIPATGEHTEEVDEAVAATCITAGKTEGSHCSVCNTVIKAQETVTALGHSFTDGTCSGCNMVDTPVVGTAYHLAMNQVKKGAVLYFNGKTQSATITYRFATTDKVVDAVEVYLENVEGVDGAYRLYFMNGETKTYIRLFERSANSPSVELTTTVPAEYYIYNSTYKTLVCTVGSNSHFLGTYDNYDTISGNKLSYLSGTNCDVSQFPVHFFAIPAGEVVVTAQDGMDNLIDQTGAFYNGVQLPTTVSVGDVEMPIVWTIETTDTNAAQIVDGKLVIAPQAAAATYTLTATISYNGETAENSWSRSVVPTSSEFANGTYVIWTADGNAVTTIAIAEGKEYAYGYLAPTSGITLTDGVLSGYVNDNLFTFTANGDGTYSITDCNGSYVYSDMSYATSKQFNVSAAKSETGADWTVVANEDGTYYIYNVDRAGAVNYSSYSNFELNTGSATALNLTVAETVDDDPSALHYVIKDYEAGEQYAENEEHVLDDVVTVISDKGHFTTELRLYNSNTNDSTAIIKSTKDINKLIVKAGYNAGDLAIYVSDYGYNWTLLETITVTSTYTNYTVSMPEDTVYGYIKLDSVTDKQQIRISEFTISVGDEIPACKHGTVADDAAVDPTFSTSGLTAGSHCAVCGYVIVAQEVIPALTDVKEWNITLGDDISVNFNIAVDSSIADSTTVEITFNGDKVYSGSVPTEKINVKVAAAQMGDTIMVKFTNGEESYTKEYSVKKYADTILAGDYDDVTKQLVTNMLAYGAAAQTYFKYNVNNLVSDGTGAGTEAPKADKEMTVTGNTDGIRFYGASLVFENKIALRFYFQVGKDVNFEISEKYTVSQKNGLYCVEIADILPQDLNKDYTVTVTDGPTVTYSPMNYLVRMNEKGGEDLQALVVALYNYHLSAVEYTK